MTNFRARLNGQTPKSHNKKDGATGHRRPCQDWEAHGFHWVPGTPSTHTYTWEGDFPVFIVKPGTVAAQAGLVARCAEAEVEILFPYGSPPSKIAERLNDEIYEIMRLDAELTEAEIGFGEYMADLAVTQ